MELLLSCTTRFECRIVLGVLSSLFSAVLLHIVICSENDNRCCKYADDPRIKNFIATFTEGEVYCTLPVTFAYFRYEIFVLYF